MIKKDRRQNLFYGILALFFSLVLFFIASGSSLQVDLSGSVNAYQEEIDAVPIQTIYDTNDYFIQGFETTVNVTLSSRNRVQLNAEKNEETRSFRVVADLSDLDVGTHEVPLEIQNISSSVSAEIEPKTVTVTIEKKVTKTYTVEPVVSTEDDSSGYAIESMVAAPQEVTITTGEQTAADIDRVVAVIDPDDIPNDSGTVSAVIEAWDINKNPLAIVADPDTVDVAITMEAPTKDVELFVTQQGTLPNGISHYIYRMSSISAALTGPQDILDQTTQIGVPVDISGITATTEQTVTIPAPDGTTINPVEVTIQITPVAQSANDSEEAAADQTSDSSTATSDNASSTSLGQESDQESVESAATSETESTN
ncbi:hypothetical protein A5886_001341 [Enterococcus sp. 8G7_MSG3316]|uniref:YbbR-like protein n=1 Tax=Candidatus Enterococcus testudinis TaxID=1834191 RepID=A0A242A5G4_9ENTE|nr:CdaR family protein [Enterococcus sp. 8G7_MSG3316]OTN76264.1 hypothetical protein A5886_001341 [Enterococcus sp. 8G7_MSG3316]